LRDQLRRLGKLKWNDRVVFECGCIDIPVLLIRSLGVDSAQCDTHGEQVIIRKATSKEVLTLYGIEVPEVSSTTPPF